MANHDQHGLESSTEEKIKDVWGIKLFTLESLKTYGVELESLSLGLVFQTETKFQEEKWTEKQTKLESCWVKEW